MKLLFTLFEDFLQRLFNLWHAFRSLISLSLSRIRIQMMNLQAWLCFENSQGGENNAAVS